jgi:crossover junction endodeoxyribonuclease RuvC
MARRGMKAEQLSARSGPDGSAPPHRGPVLGIDPGLERTGYAVLCEAPGASEVCLAEAGLIRLSVRQPLERRLAELDESLEMLLQTHRPTLLACEELYAHYRHPRTAILMGHARGVILAAAARQRLQVVSIAATHVKKVLTGSGHAAKHQVQFAVAATLGLRHMPEPPDVADAIAIALCGLRLRRLNGLPQGLEPRPSNDARRRPTGRICGVAKEARR